MRGRPIGATDKFTMEQQRLWLPAPLSVNEIFRNATGADIQHAGRFKTREYELWRQRAMQELMIQRPKPYPHPTRVKLDFFLGELSPLADCSNYIKGMEDALVAYGTIAGDHRQCVQGVSIMWVPRYVGAVVHITPVANSDMPWLGFDKGVLGNKEGSPPNAFTSSPQTLGSHRRKQTGEAWATPEGETGRSRATARAKAKYVRKRT